MGTTVGYGSRKDPTRDNLFVNADASLASFFERPIVAATYTWTPLQGAPFTAIFDPWSLFFGNKRVINRINNYAQMRANLHVRFTINGNGFYYGRLMADYAPMPGDDEVSSYATLVAENAVQASQRMKVFIDPSDCCSNELHLPFVWYKDAVTPTLAEWSSLGTIYVRELNGLKHANGSTQPLTISVFIWATDVQMSMPTSVNSLALIAQAGEDEYTEPGPVQNTASAVAKAAAALTSLPVIGPYARATSMAAGAAAKMAGVMGWSRPADIRALDGMRPTYVSPLAACDGGDMPQKLTVDSKQEVTVDPSIIGIELPDEMSIAGIAARESYLTTFSWTTARVAGDLLWTSRVVPYLPRVSGTTYYLPACTFASLPFKFWRGKMRYRFQIVASAHHKGRLRLVWDPYLIVGLESNVQYTRIIDMSEERDITIEIDWGQSKHYCEMPNYGDTVPYRATPDFPTAFPDTYNGVLGLYVLNDLATPNSTVNNDISVNVYVSAIDLRVAAPRGVPAATNTYSATVQAGEDMMSVMDGSDPGCGTATSTYHVSGVEDDINDDGVFFGEKVISFRQLLRRYSYYSGYLIANTSTTVPATWDASSPDVPPVYGYNNNTFHVTTAAGKFNYVHRTMLAYLQLAFVAMRGSQRSKYIVAPSAQGQVQRATIRRGIFSTVNLAAVPTLMNTGTQSLFGRSSRVQRSDLMAGAAITPGHQQPVLEIEFPYYKSVRFDAARKVSVNADQQNPSYSSHTLELLLTPGTASVVVDRYVGVGEDFGLYWFQGCPPLTALAVPA